MNFNELLRKSLFTVLAIAFSTATAFGQKNDTPKINPPTNVTEGGEKSSSNDFYIRAGVVFDWSDEAQFTDNDCSDKHLYGCAAPSKDGNRLRSLGDFGIMEGFELGVGYAAIPALRLEALFYRHPDFSFDGFANYTISDLDYPQSVSAELSSWSGLFVSYLDLSELGLTWSAPLSPFVGGGFGFSRISIGETEIDFPNRKTIVPGGKEISLAWTLTAGTAIPLGDRVTLDIAWRYVDHGTVKTGEGDGKVIRKDDGSCVVCPLPLFKTQADLKSHGLQMSLRYAF